MLLELRQSLAAINKGVETFGLNRLPTDYIDIITLGFSFVMRGRWLVEMVFPDPSQPGILPES